MLRAGSAVFGARTRLQVQPRRSAVVVEANLFSRVARVFRSYANAIGAHFAWRQCAWVTAQHTHDTVCM